MVLPDVGGCVVGRVVAMVVGCWSVVAKVAVVGGACVPDEKNHISVYHFAYIQGVIRLTR